MSKKMNLTLQQSQDLWEILDRDASGEVELDELSTALKGFQAARAWMRFCPDCIYTNACVYCQECNMTCELCTEAHFCARHWADHPRNIEAKAASVDAGRRVTMSTSEILRDRFVIRPLTFVYSR